MGKQNNKSKFWAVVPAAGLGLRMESIIQKQYLSLMDKTIAEHTVSVIASHPMVEKVVVALHPEDINWEKLNIPHQEKLITTVGGAKRANSVLQGLNLLEEFAKPNDWVIVHDAVRPCVKHADITRLIEHLEGHPVGGLLAIPVRDTLKRVNDNQEVIETLSRDNTWNAQTPQMFRFKILKQAITQALEAHSAVTDESSAVELMGLQPLIVKGDPRNLKITYPEDLFLAEKFIREVDETS